VIQEIGQWKHGLRISYIITLLPTRVTMCIMILHMISMVTLTPPSCLFFNEHVKEGEQVKYLVFQKFKNPFNHLWFTASYCFNVLLGQWKMETPKHLVCSYHIILLSSARGILWLSKNQGQWIGKIHII
jgi:hypothetical protein